MRRLLIAATACLLAGSAQAATAYFDLHYDGPGVNGSASLRVDTSSMRVVGISGVRNGVGITGVAQLSSFASNDNIVSLTAPFVDFSGLAFSIGNQGYNLASDSGSYYECTSSDCTPGYNTSLLSGLTISQATTALYSLNYVGDDTALSAILTVDTSLGGVPQIVDISGTRNGQMIERILSPTIFAGNDNLFLPKAPPISYGGLAFRVGGVDYNVAAFNGDMYECRIAACTPSEGSALLKSLNVEAVPEPATWALMIVGFGLVGGASRARRRTGSHHA